MILHHKTSRRPARTRIVRANIFRRLVAESIVNVSSRHTAGSLRNTLPVAIIDIRGNRAIHVRRHLPVLRIIRKAASHRSFLDQIAVEIVSPPHNLIGSAGRKRSRRLRRLRGQSRQHGRRAGGRIEPVVPQRVLTVRRSPVRSAAAARQQRCASRLIGAVEPVQMIVFVILRHAQSAACRLNLL